MQNHNQEHICTLAKSLSTLMTNTQQRPNPQLTQEQDLLIQIANLSNNETALNAKDLFHPSKNVYDFKDYLSWLSYLERLLIDGTSTDEAFDTVRNSIDNKYQDTIAIFKDYL